MKVTKTNEAGYRFWVESSSDREPYLVDLTANKGLPVCTCDDNRCRCQPKLKILQKIVRHFYRDRTICKHVDAAIFYCGCMVVAAATNKKADDVFHQYTKKEDKDQYE